MIYSISVFYFPDAVQDLLLHCNKYHLLGRKNLNKTPRTNKQNQKALIKRSDCSWQDKTLSTLLTLNMVVTRVSLACSLLEAMTAWRASAWIKLPVRVHWQSKLWCQEQISLNFLINLFRNIFSLIQSNRSYIQVTK